MRISIMMACVSLLLSGCAGRALPAIGGADGGVDPRADGQTGQPGKVTVTTNLLTYGSSQATRGTVHNGTDKSIWLPGCVIFSREMKDPATGKWQDKGAEVLCGWEGEAVEVKPGATHGQEASFRKPGTWRLTLGYGTGCTKGKPMNMTHCTGEGAAASPAVTVTLDKATCVALNKSYRAALEPAKKCNPYINMLQCQEQVAGDLSCGCPLFVQNRKILDSYAEQWASWGCHKLMPPCAIKCSPPAPAGCSKDGKCATGK